MIQINKYLNFRYLKKAANNKKMKIKNENEEILEDDAASTATKSQKSIGLNDTDDLLLKENSQTHAYETASSSSSHHTNSSENMDDCKFTASSSNDKTSEDNSTLNSKSDEYVSVNINNNNNNNRLVDDLDDENSANDHDENVGDEDEDYNDDEDDDENDENGENAKLLEAKDKTITDATTSNDVEKQSITNIGCHSLREKETKVTLKVKYLILVVFFSKVVSTHKNKQNKFYLAYVVLTKKNFTSTQIM